MRKSQEIRILLLSTVYLFLLSLIILPHHHHEEVACYTAAHCEDDLDVHQASPLEINDHHHDKNSGEEPEHCISIEYYVIADAGKTFKQFSVAVLPEYGHDFLSIRNTCFEDNIETDNGYESFRFLSIRNTYSVVAKHELPLRAPPLCLA